MKIDELETCWSMLLFFTKFLFLQKGGFDFDLSLEILSIEFIVTFFAISYH